LKKLWEVNHRPRIYHVVIVEGKKPKNLQPQIPHYRTDMVKSSKGNQRDYECLQLKKEEPPSKDELELVIAKFVV
jgi:hypothetical protein